MPTSQYISEKVMECHAVELTPVNLAHLPSVHSNAASDVRTRHRAWTVFANLMNEAMREPTGADWIDFSSRSFLLPINKNANLL